MAYIDKAKTVEWGTPAKLFSELNAEFHFTLDACSSLEMAKCDEYLQAHDDALLQKWHLSTFCNPPYGPQLSKWIHKAWEESRRGNTVVMLLPARTDTRWFHEFCLLPCAEIRWIRGRLYFNDGTGRAPFPSMIVVFRPVWAKSALRE